MITPSTLYPVHLTGSSVTKIQFLGLKLGLI